MDSNLESILEVGETIKWQGKVSRKALGFVLFLSLFFIAVLTAFFIFTFSDKFNLSLVIFLVLCSFAGLNFFIEYVKIFAITEKRLIIRSGIIGADYNSLYFPQIKTTNIRVDLIDKIFSVGTIYIDTGKIETVEAQKSVGTRTAYDKLSYIDKPYEVYQILQKFLSERQESLYSGRADKQ